MARRRRKRKQLVNLDDLAPGIAKGLTQDVSAAEALQEHPVSSNPSGIEIARNFSAAMKRAEEDPSDRSVHFIARVDPDTELVEPNTGRRMVDAHVILPPEHRRQIISGYRCINCYERFDVAWPAACDVCGFEVRKRQMLRAAHEFEGDVHVGPARPIGEYLDDLELRKEKREFEERIAAGKSPMKGLR